MNMPSALLSKGRSVPRRVVELLLFVLVGILVWTVSAHYDVMERLFRYSEAHEDWEIDEYIFFCVYFTFALTAFAVRRWLELRRSEKALAKETGELQEALAQVRQLQGILPICASCKKVRDDRGYWQEVESYISEHSEAQFSHGLCEACLEKLYPDIIQDVQRSQPDRMV